MAPDFAVLLESKLLNATDKDSHGHRWDKKIITLCLHLWAKSVSVLIYHNFVTWGQVSMNTLILSITCLGAENLTKWFPCFAC